MHPTPSLLLFFIVSVLLLPVGQPAAQENPVARKLFNQGNASFRSGDHAKAIERYDSALSIVRHEFFAYQKGLAWRKLHREDNARAAFREAIEINAKFAPAYSAIGGGFFAAHDYDSAIVYYKRALEVDPSLGPAKKGLANARTAKASILLRSGETAAALELSLQAVADFPDLAQAYIVMARACNRLHRTESAITAGQSGLKVAKGSSKAALQFELGVAFRAAGDTTTARQFLTEAMEHPSYRVNAAAELERMK